MNQITVMYFITNKTNPMTYGVVVGQAIDTPFIASVESQMQGGRTL